MVTSPMILSDPNTGFKVTGSGVFRITQRGGGNPSLPFPSLLPPFPSLPSLPSLPSPPFLSLPSLPLPLEVGPLVAARGSGGAL